MVLQSFQFILFCVQKMILYQIVVRISTKLFPLMTLCISLMKRTSWPMKILIVVLLSTMKLLQKSDRSTENGITFPDPVKNPSEIPVTISITVLFMGSLALISLWTRTISGTWFRQLLCHSTTLMTDTLCPISTLNQQLTNLKQSHIRLSPHCERWTIKGRDRAVNFAFFQRNYLPDGRVNETVATVEELSDLWKPGAMDGITPFVMNSICS